METETETKSNEGSKGEEWIVTEKNAQFEMPIKRYTG